MASGPDVDALVEFIGEGEAGRLAELARTGFFGIPAAAYDELGRATQGFAGKYAQKQYAREALQELMKRYPESP